MKSNLFRAPRAILAGQQHLGAIRSSMVYAMAGEPQGGDRRGAAAVISDLQASIDGFKADQGQRLNEVETALNDVSLQIAAMKAAPGSSRSDVPADPTYSRAFGAMIRTGSASEDLVSANKTGRLAAIQAAMSVGSNSDGGYLAPTEWDRTINKALLPLSPMRRLATVVETSVSAYSKVWNLRGTASGWVGETAARPETTGPSLASLVFGHGEIYANPSATQRLLDDAQVDMEKFLAGEIAEEFTKQESLAFVAGNGTNKPYGFLTYATGAANASVHPGGAIQVSTAAGTTAVTTDELVSLTFALAAPYRQNATWLMNSATAAVIAKLKDGQGNYIWREAFTAGLPSTLLGRPVEYDENMPSMTTGAIPIAFGDFRAGYLINDRYGVRILRDPYTAKPYVLFYATKRVGGGVQDPNAIRVLKMA